MVLPLEDVRIIDLGRILPTPFASMMLADMGAEVIKVEDVEDRAGVGRDMLTPPSPSAEVEEKSCAYNHLGRNKKSIAMNLRLEEARQVFYRLAAKVDVIIELTDGGSSYQMTLSQPGLSDQYSSETYKGYKFSFNVNPYPEADKQISPDEYRLSLIISDGGTQQTGTLRGQVTIGPIWPVERPGDNFPISPEVYEARKVMVYDRHGSKLIKKVDLEHDGSYTVELNPGTYMIDINRLGIDSSSDVPREVEIRSGEVVEVDIDIDTGIR